MAEFHNDGLILTKMPYLQYRYFFNLFFSLRKRSFGLFLIRSQIQDLDPDSNPGFESGIESGFESGSETGSESETH